LSEEYGLLSGDRSETNAFVQFRSSFKFSIMKKICSLVWLEPVLQQYSQVICEKKAKSKGTALKRPHPKLTKPYDLLAVTHHHKEGGVFPPFIAKRASFLKVNNAQSTG
jgi:hypothetical protein